MIVAATLIHNVETSSELFFDEMLLKRLQFLEPDAFIVTKMWHEAHQEVYLLNRHRKLGLRDHAPIDTSVNLNHFGHLVLTRGKVVPGHLALPKAEERVFFDRVGHLRLRALHNRQMQRASDDEVEVIRHLAFLIERLAHR